MTLPGFPKGVRHKMLSLDTAAGACSIRGLRTDRQALRRLDAVALGATAGGVWRT